MINESINQTSAKSILLNYEQDIKMIKKLKHYFDIIKSEYEKHKCDKNKNIEKLDKAIALFNNLDRLNKSDNVENITKCRRDLTKLHKETKVLYDNYIKQLDNYEKIDKDIEYLKNNNSKTDISAIDNNLKNILQHANLINKEINNIKTELDKLKESLGTIGKSIDDLLICFKNTNKSDKNKSQALINKELLSKAKTDGIKYIKNTQKIANQMISENQILNSDNFIELVRIIKEIDSYKLSVSSREFQQDCKNIQDDIMEKIIQKINETNKNEITIDTLLTCKEQLEKKLKKNIEASCIQEISIYQNYKKIKIQLETLIKEKEDFQKPEEPKNKKTN